MFETRAQRLGLVGARSPKAMAARTKRSIAKIRERIEALAAPYAEIDEGVEYDLQELLDRFDEFAERIDETVEWLQEEAPYQ